MTLGLGLNLWGQQAQTQSVDFFTAADATERSTSTLNAWADLTTITIDAADLRANTDYLILWSCEGKHSAAQALCGVRLFRDGTTELYRQIVAPRTVNVPEDYFSMGGIARLQVGASPANVEYKLQVANLSATGTATAKRARVTLFRLGADDYYTESTARQTTTSTTFTTAASLNFTPSTAGDYLIIATAQHDGGGVVVTNYRISDAGGDTGDVGTTVGNTTARPPVAFLRRRNGLSGAQTINWDYRTTNAGAPAGIEQMRIAAIRIDGRSDFNMATSGADNTGTDGAYTTAVSQTFTPTARPHIAIAAWRMAGSSTTATNQSRFDDGGTVSNEFIRQPRIANTDFNYGFTHNVATYAATSRTQEIDRLSESGNSTNISAASSIVCFEV